ncbi:hypothetical protein BJV82DRAFT_674567 [Fennellomyces sp. T-0311]|nr:hypothetical protein BJV82DRAFT_674567 [Fennellomyces sp. T-0311]
MSPGQVAELGDNPPSPPTGNETKGLTSQNSLLAQLASQGSDTSFRSSQVFELSQDSFNNNTDPNAMRIQAPGEWEFHQRMAAMESRMTIHEQRMHAQEEETKNVQISDKQNEALLKKHDELIQLNEELGRRNAILEQELMHARQRINELESQKPQSMSTPSKKDATDTPETDDELLTGTCESIHMVPTEEWEERKLEIADAKAKLERRKEEKLQQQLKKLEQQERLQKRQHAPKEQNKASPSYAKVTSRNITPKKKTIKPPPEKLINWAHRILQPATANTAYTLVYMPSPRRTLHSEIRRALQNLGTYNMSGLEAASDIKTSSVVHSPYFRPRYFKPALGVAQERIIDVHFPAHGIVGLLIHVSYEKDLRELLKKAKLTPKDDFSPVSASTIGDPKSLATKTEEERATEAKKLYQERTLGMCLRMPKKHLGIAILRLFTSLPAEHNHHIGLEYWERFQKENPQPVHRQRQLVTSADEARKLLSGEKVDNGKESEPMEGIE